MTIHIKLQNVTTGLSGTYTMQYADEFLANLPYMFREGNYSCDCNRAIFLAEATDTDIPINTPCSTDSRQIIIWRIRDDQGNTLYTDV